MSDLIETNLVSKYFLILALINTIAAICFTLPILLPTSGLPLIIGAFPGTWLIVGYFVFLIVGVIGTLGWSIATLMSANKVDSWFDGGSENKKHNQ